MSVNIDDLPETPPADYDDGDANEVDDDLADPTDNFDADDTERSVKNDGNSPTV